jgi:hypothetical protein
MAYSYKQVSLTIHEDEANQWTEFSKALGISRTEMLRRAVLALKVRLDALKTAGAAELAEKE